MHKAVTDDNWGKTCSQKPGRGLKMLFFGQSVTLVEVEVGEFHGFIRIPDRTVLAMKIER